MTELSSADPFIRRREAGDFLRSRRERLSPADVGLPSGVRRRTRGLRREEVAYLAGVGTTWYTWLEQGRDVRPSNELLMALAQALRLDPIERGHLFALNDRPAPARRVEGPELIGGPLRRMLDSLVGQPAYVLGRRWDILAWSTVRTSGCRTTSVTHCNSCLPIRPIGVCWLIGNRWRARHSRCFAPTTRAMPGIRTSSA